jgi:multiple sugar transport system substrate-binding protein
VAPDASNQQLGVDGTAFPGSMSRRRLLQVAGTGALGLTGLGALAGCGGSDSGGKDTGGSGPLSFVYLGTAEQQKQWNELFAAFNKKHPDIKLKATGVPVDNWAAFFDKVSTQLGGGTKYDLVQVATEGMQLFATRGLLHPLDDFIKADKAAVDEYLSDASPKIAEWNKTYASPDGKTYYMPGDFNTMCLWFNKEVFQKAGSDLPTDEWTWDDFYAAGKQIKARAGAFLYPATPEYFIGVMPWLLTNGASTLDTEWKEATADTPAAIAAAEFNQKLVKDKLSPAPGGSFDRFTLAVQGKLASFGGGRWPIVNIRAQNAVDKFGIVAWPHRDAQKGSPVGWGTFPIFKSSDKKDKAWTFIKFTFSKEGSAFFAKLGGTIVPARRSIATSEEYLANSPEGTEKLYEALEYATPIPSPPKGNLIQRSIEDSWGQILGGNVAPDAGMKRMQQSIQQNL